MRRVTSVPRADWQARVEAEGLIWHSDADGAYWDESAYYSFTLAEIEGFEAQTEEVGTLYRAAGERIAGDVDRLIGEAIRRIADESSVSSLFD